LRELNSPVTRLLIIDNAEDEKTTTPWIPNTGGCHTLITSRFTGFSEAVKTLHLSVLDKGSALEFLHRRAERSTTGPERTDCETLVARLGCLPFALEQAAAYIKKLCLSFTDYLQIYEKAACDLLALEAPGSTDHLDSVIISLQPSIKQIGPGARAILLLASMVATTPIPKELIAAKPELIFKHAARLTQSNTFNAPTNFEFWLLKEIASLVDYSLAAFDGHNLSLHPLMLTVQYETQPIEERRCNWSDVAEMLVATSPLPTWKIDCREQWTLENSRKWEHLTPQIDRLLQLQQNIPELPFNPMFELLAINTYAAQESYPRAISLCRSLCERLTVATVKPQNALLEAKDSLASLLKQNDLIQEALDEFRSLYELRVKLHGEDHIGALRALHNVACLMELLGDTADAEALMRDVLARRKRLLGEDHYDTETSMHDLGWLLTNHPEKRDEAEPLLRHTLDRWRSTLGIANPDTRTAASNLAGLLRSRGDFQEAVKVQRDLVDGTIEVLGPDHLVCFEVMHNLALFECNAGHDPEAHTIIADVVNGYRRYLPPNHRDMLTALQDLGTILGRLGRLTEAETLLTEALAGYESTQGSEAKDTLRTVNNLAGVLDELGRHDDAKPLHLRHLRAVSKKDDAAPGELRAAAHTCLTMGEYDLAESLLKRVLAARFEVPGSHCHLARIYMLTNKDEAARKEIAQAWEHRTNAQPFYVVARMLFFKMLFCMLDDTDLGQVLGLLKGAFTHEAAHMGWSIQMVIDHVKPRLPSAKIALLEALASAIDDKTNLQRLDAFPQWLDAPSLTLD
jgi:tetratricopeptide (TPR) repeat protein